MTLRSRPQKTQPDPVQLNSGVMKSYQLINTPMQPVAEQRVARVAKQLLELGFVIITARFGDRPSITVKPTAATRQLESVYTGQHGEGGQMFNSYAAGVDGVLVVWHKPKKALVTH